MSNRESVGRQQTKKN